MLLLVPIEVKCIFCGSDKIKLENIKLSKKLELSPEKDIEPTSFSFHCNDCDEDFWGLLRFSA